MYEKLSELRLFSKTLREPYRSRFDALINSAYQNISSAVFTNSLDDDEFVIYAMLAKLPDTIENKEKIQRCLSILLSR